jgi:predicted ATP-grasp superfamily ATP-dependent carboligase
MYKVILTDIQTRKGFDIYNIFKHKVDCERILYATKKVSPLFSFLFNDKINYLDSENSAHFNQTLLKLTQEYPQDTFIYFPVSDQCNLLFYDFINLYPEANILYLLPEIDIYKLCINKDDFEDFCVANNFLTPKKYNKEELYIAHFDNYPLIVKPTVGTGSKGIFFIESKEELHQLEYIDVDKHLIQERIQSIEVLGAFFLMHKGELVAYYGHKRLRTSPLTGGVTVCSVTDFNPELKEIGVNVLKKLNYNGVAMIEFLYDEKDKSYKIIELNPRAWGSYLLGEFIGANFSEKYVKLLKKETATEKTLKKDIAYIKWFIPYEIINAIKGRISMSELFRFKNTCFINMTYSSFFRSFFFFVYSSLDVKYLLSKLKR